MVIAAQGPLPIHPPENYMFRVTTRRRGAFARAARLTVAVLAISACSSGDHKAADTTGSAAPAANATDLSGGNTMSDSTKGASGMQGMAMTGDPDRDFLRMMSDHHKGMILMAHMTKDRKDGSAAADAEKLDTKQDGELDKMVTMLEKTYKDAYAPKVMPDNQAMADDLKGKTGTDYDRAFYQNVIKHHGQAVQMVDEYLPKAKSPVVKKMAEMMKADQSREITEFQQKLGQVK